MIFLHACVIKFYFEINILEPQNSWNFTEFSRSKTLPTLNPPVFHSFNDAEQTASGISARVPLTTRYNTAFSTVIKKKREERGLTKTKQMISLPRGRDEERRKKILKSQKFASLKSFFFPWKFLGKFFRNCAQREIILNEIILHSACEETHLFVLHFCDDVSSSCIFTSSIFCKYNASL